MPTLAIITTSDEERPLLHAPVDSGIDVMRVPMRVPGFARNQYDRFFVALGHIDAAERAVADGCDAIFIDTFGDYGIAEIRLAVPVPVIGAGEAGIAAASANGTRGFSIVTVWPQSMHYLYKERLDNSPGGDCCRRVEHALPESELQKVGTDAFVKNRMVRHDASIIDVLAGCVQQVADEDGVGTVLLGCTCMAPIAPAIQERVSVEVIEGTRAGLAATWAAMAVPAPDVIMSPRHGTVRLIVDAWLEHGVVPAFHADECEMCVSFAPGDDEIAAPVV